MSTQPSRSLSISCRGEPISHEDLFKYTKGRFLVREKEQLDARYLKFDVDQLCAVAASIGSPSPVRAIEKFENRHGKVLLMTKEDGSELVAKLPFSYAGPQKYMTASEAAVLQYLHDHTKVPVPKLLVWNADASNPVGAEYVITEKAAGCRLSKKWDEMDEKSHIELIENLCRLECELAAVKFPAYGSLYLRESMEDGDNYEPLAPEMDPSGRYCVGQSCRRDDTESIQVRIDPEPWHTLQAFGIALVERQITCIEQSPRPYEPHKPLHCSIEEQVSVLKMAKTVFSNMDSQTAPGQVAQPTLWHSDLHMGNIFVSDQDPTQIVSLIDWQRSVIWPLLCQVRFPVFIDVDSDYEVGSEVPSLPEDMDQMDEESQAIARYENEVVRMAKTYEHGCGLNNRDVSEALQLPIVFSNLISHCERAWRESAVPIRNCVLEIAEIWDQAGFSGDFPFEFSEDNIKKYMEEAKLYRTHQNVLALAQEALDTDSDGWVHASEDFEEKQEKNKEVLEIVLAGVAADGESPERARAIWPFPERPSSY